MMWLLAPACAVFAAFGAQSPAESRTGGSLVVQGRIVHTMAGPPIRDGLVWIENGRIRAVGPAAELDPPADLPRLTANVVTPGLVDGRSVVGLAGAWNIDHDKDELERSAPIQPELRAIDAYNPSEPLVAWVRSFGVTTVHTGHAPGALISGQTMVVKTRGRTVEEAVLVPEAMVAATLGEGAQGGSGAPGTRARAAAMLRKELIEADDYRARWRRYREAMAEYEAARDSTETPEDGPTDEARRAPEPPRRELRKEALARVLDGELPLLVTAQRAHDLMTALRLAEEFPGLRLVLDGAAEAPLVLDRIVAAGVPVIAHPTMQRAGGEAEALSFTTPKALLEAGIQTALQSGYESYVPRTRVVLFEAAIAARYGLSFDQALALVTREPARLLGLDHRIGTLEPGKDADLALYDGDPFEYTKRCLRVIIDGEVFTGESPGLPR